MTLESDDERTAVLVFLRGMAEDQRAAARAQAFAPDRMVYLRKAELLGMVANSIEKGRHAVSAESKHRKLRDRHEVLRRAAQAVVKARYDVRDDETLKKAIFDLSAALGGRWAGNPPFPEVGSDE